MSELKKMQVVIDNITYTLVGRESEEYMKKVSRYIDQKMKAVRSTSSGSMMSQNMVAVLAAVNVTDDYMKLYDAQAKAVAEQAECKRELQLAHKELEVVSKENEALREVISSLEIELYKARNELSEYIETFEQKNAKVSS